MSELSKKARADMKEKARRLGGDGMADIGKNDPHKKVDASSWEPTDALNADAKTGMRPLSPRQFKRGGKVAGSAAPKHMGRKARKSGGRARGDGGRGEDKLTPDNLVTRDIKEGNYKLGHPHIGGFKRGGHADEKEDRSLVKKMVKGKCRTGKKGGGFNQDEQHAINSVLGARSRKTGLRPQTDSADEAIFDQARPRLMAQRYAAYKAGKEPPMDLTPDMEIKKRGGSANKKRTAKKDGGAMGANYLGGTRPTGGRLAKAKGGKSSKKAGTDINIVIAPGGRGAQPMPQQMQPPQQPPPRPMPVAPPMNPAMMQGAGAMPPGAMGGMPPQGLPPGMMPPGMPRKDGGKVGKRKYRSYKDMDAGSGGGMGRLEKTEIAAR